MTPDTEAAAARLADAVETWDADDEAEALYEAGLLDGIASHIARGKRTRVGAAYAYRTTIEDAQCAVIGSAADHLRAALVEIARLRAEHLAHPAPAAVVGEVTLETLRELNANADKDLGVSASRLAEVLEDGIKRTWPSHRPQPDFEADGEFIAACIKYVRRALAADPPVPPVPGWQLVPCEPDATMIAAAIEALTIWRKGLSSDEAILRRSAPVQSGRVWLASATPEEKAAIRYRAMIASAPRPGEAK